MNVAVSLFVALYSQPSGTSIESARYSIHKEEEKS